ncbi:MAG TPA: metalloregulator ArsR/SmtB family transcription factor [Gemmatimonadales bacterium]|nr:metalloregulator ArsR/SmtB family transcription factor [Gemmatimonadales bacterium]
MVTNAASLDAVYSALGDRTRRAILTRLAAREHTVGELAEPFAVSRPAISKHLRVLERAGLVRRTRQGRRSRCRLEPKPLAAAARWLEHHRRFWEDRLARLDAFLQSQKRKEEEHAHDN